MGNCAGKDSSQEQAAFKVANIDDDERHVRKGEMAVTSCALIYTDGKTKKISDWPYKFLRRYGCDGDIFSFEAGRSCDEPGSYAFYVYYKKANNLFTLLNQKNPQGNMQHEMVFPIRNPPQVVLPSPIPAEHLQSRNPTESDISSKVILSKESSPKPVHSQGNAKSHTSLNEGDCPKHHHTSSGSSSGKKKRRRSHRNHFHSCSSVLPEADQQVTHQPAPPTQQPAPPTQLSDDKDSHTVHEEKPANVDLKPAGDETETPTKNLDCQNELGSPIQSSPIAEREVYKPPSTPTIHPEYVNLIPGTAPMPNYVNIPCGYYIQLDFSGNNSAETGSEKAATLSSVSRSQEIPQDIPHVDYKHLSFEEMNTLKCLKEEKGREIRKKEEEREARQQKMTIKRRSLSFSKI